VPADERRLLRLKRFTDHRKDLSIARIGDDRRWLDEFQDRGERPAAVQANIDSASHSNQWVRQAGENRAA
jgi:hypothetical protein